MLCICNLHHNMLAGPGRRGPGWQPLAWPVAGQTTGSKLLSQNAPGTVEPATPGTDGNSFRPPSLPAGARRWGGWGHSHRNSIADISRHSLATGRAPEHPWTHCGSGARVAERFTRSGARCAWSDTRCISDAHVQRARFLARIVQQMMLKVCKS